MRVAQNDSDDRARLRGYVQFNKYTHAIISIIYALGRMNASGIEGLGRIIRPNCAVMYNSIKLHTHKHTHTQDAQASFQILRLSATSRLSHLLRTVPPSITGQAAANYDALVEWALASIIAGDGAAAAGLPTPEEVAHDPTVARGPTTGPPANPRRRPWAYQQ